MSVIRVGDLCSGHGCYPPRQCISGSPNVLINGSPVHRLGDLWAIHTCTLPPFPSHSGIQASASQTVFVNGIPVCRKGDLVDCGSTMVGGSPDVIQG